MKETLTVGVLANDNPQGLLLASRLVGHATVRVSLGGRLARLLEDGWTLKCEDELGRLQTVRTRVVKRGEGEGAESTREEESATNGSSTLWLCDWKDPATGWYSLSDCHLLLQTSKATDSKTVAMWLVEVCKDDAVIISLQAGLHNARELRTVFGHVNDGSGAVTKDMPLVASQTGRKGAGSIDTVDGGFQRRDSASSIYSEFSSMDEDALAANEGSFERSSSPVPPGGGAKDSSIRRSLLESSSRSNSPTNDEPLTWGVSQATTPRGSPIQEDRRGSTCSSADATPAGKSDEKGNNENSLSPAASPAISADANSNSNMRKPQAVLLAGLLGYGACCLMDEESKTITCMMTHHGSMVVERLTKLNALQALGRLMLLERAGFKVRYRAHEETNNWLWGDVVWRTFEAYGAALRMARPNEPKSLYALLCDKDPLHRRVYAGLLDEALSALRWQKVELMDPVSSPFGLGFRATRSLLLLPQPVFETCLWLVLCVRFYLEPKVKPEAPYCDTTMMHRYMAPFLNGEVVRIGFEGEVVTPLNQEILESLSVVSKQYDAAFKAGRTMPPSTIPLVKQTPLPPLYSMSSLIAVLSCIVLVLALTITFIAFVIDVTFFW